MITLSLDPSVQNRAGWATYNSETQDWNWGNVQTEGLNFKVRCWNLYNELQKVALPFDQLVCEWPMYYQGERGQIAAQQGYTINLAGIVMFIVGCFGVVPKNLFLITAPEWKGSVPKQVTARRFIKMFGEEYSKLDHDTVDAIMMLAFHLKKTGQIK